MNKKFKRHKDYGVFNQNIRLCKLSDLDDPMDRLNNHIDFELFRTYLPDSLTIKGKDGLLPSAYSDQ